MYDPGATRVRQGFPPSHTPTLIIARIPDCDIKATGRPSYNGRNVSQGLGSPKAYRHAGLGVMSGRTEGHRSLYASFPFHLDRLWIERALKGNY